MAHILFVSAWGMVLTFSMVAGPAAFCGVLFMAALLAYGYFMTVGDDEDTEESNQ